MLVLFDHLYQIFADFFVANRNIDSNFDLKDYNVTFDPITKEATVEVNNKFKPYIMDAFVSEDFDVSIKSSVIAAAVSEIKGSF